MDPIFDLLCKGTKQQHNFYFQSLTYQNLLEEMFPTAKALKEDGLPCRTTISLAAQTEGKLLGFR